MSAIPRSTQSPATNPTSSQQVHQSKSALAVGRFYAHGADRVLLLALRHERQLGFNL